MSLYSGQVLNKGIFINYGIALVLDEHLRAPVGGIRQEASSLTVDAVMHADQWARQRAAELLESRHGAGQTAETLDQGAP